MIRLASVIKGEFTDLHLTVPIHRGGNWQSFDYPRSNFQLFRLYETKLTMPFPAGLVIDFECRSSVLNEPDFPEWIFNKRALI